MTAEGVFPKVAGDIAYASEANGFRGAGVLLSIGSTSIYSSGTDSWLGPIGSFVIPANTMGDPSVLKIDFCTRGTEGPATGVSIRVSGLNANANFSVSAQTTEPVGDLSFCIGSQTRNSGILKYNANNSTTSYSAGAATTNPILTTQDNVVLFTLTNNGSYQIYWNARAEGRGY